MVVERARHCHMNTEANQKQKETVKEKCLSEKILKCKNNHLQTSDMRSNSSFKGIHNFFLVAFCLFKISPMMNTFFNFVCC